MMEKRAALPWETLMESSHFRLRRSGRFLVAELVGPHRVLSTSVCQGGQVDHVRFLLNHQSCEATAHDERHRVLTEHGLEAYHDRVCCEVGLPAADTASMGTAANMNYAAVVTRTDESLAVTAVVTAGVEGNAMCAGDPAGWRETESGIHKVVYEGTINTFLLVNTPLSVPALARAVVTMTEGKSAALQRLVVSSRESVELATGTGTDQYCIAAPMAEGRMLHWASPHFKLGELIGVSVRDATLEALRWQNGLETSYTRGAFYALGRYGLKEATFFEDIAADLEGADLALLRNNGKAALFEPLVGAAAHALAAVLDRVRQGTLPASVSTDAVVQQAATLAASLAAQLDRWPEFRLRLHPYAHAGPRRLVLAAIALGWREKWLV